MCIFVHGHVCVPNSAHVLVSLCARVPVCSCLFQYACVWAAHKPEDACVQFVYISLCLSLSVYAPVCTYLGCVCTYVCVWMLM